MPIRYVPLALVALGTLFRTPALLAQGAGGDRALSEGPRVFFDC